MGNPCYRDGSHARVFLSLMCQPLLDRSTSFHAEAAMPEIGTTAAAFFEAKNQQLRISSRYLVKVEE